MPASAGAHPLGNGDHTSSTQTPLQPRIKQSRPHSPLHSPTDHNQSSESKPPAPKRARKAINCEPCRNSKLKCDRNRPCSSCVLRGTTASCYQNQDSDFTGRGDEQSQSRIDPGAEFRRIRQSLTLLESHIFTLGGSGRYPPGQLPAGTASPPKAHAPQNHGPITSPYRNGTVKDARSTSPDLSDVKTGNVPGLLGQSDNSGFYAGPTSALSHLLSVSVREDGQEGPLPSIDNLSSSLRSSNVISESPTPSGSYQSYDEDLISLLPPIHTVDGLIDYYFEYCNWIYRHVNQQAFMKSWGRFKSGHGGDRVVLATVCILILLAVRYLPNGHPLLATLPGTSEDLEIRYYGVMREALQRHNRDLRRDGLGKGYSLDLVELLLIRSHYLTFAKEDPEETWSVKGEVVNIGTAMGLHRDPGDTRFNRDEAERRRWAWWHIVLLERWQAFMFGRPISIASNHFNTRLPSYCDPALDKSGRLYLPNIALFKLAYVLGDIMDDAVSFRPVAYTSVQDNDDKLAKWFDELPDELDLDEYRVARSLASPITSVRRLGVQSVIIRTAFYHIRFTLHRPYASVPASLNAAVGAASKLITLVGQTRPEFLSNTALAVPGHMNWGPFHVFSAAMFFSFQLIAQPDQPAVQLFRDNIKKAIASLEQSRWMPVADKALTILQALAPLYSDEFSSEPPQERKRKKSQILKLVKTLAFPYQDAPVPRGDSSSGSSPSLGALHNSFGEVPSPSAMFGPIQKQTQTQLPVSSVRWTPADVESPTNQRAYAEGSAAYSRHSPSVPTGSGQAIPQHIQQQSAGPSNYNVPYSAVPMQTSGMGMQDGQNSFYVQPPADESSMWGASVGFGLGEWEQFVRMSN